MDGFDTDTKVIVLAATNREDVLDSALLRAGRFDRRVTVDAPDLQGRIAILKVHSRNKKLAADVRLEDIAKITPGFVGADIANLLNEAAILAARRSSDTITMEDLDEAVDKIGMGLGQKGKIIKPEEKRLLAYHEAGHAVMTELTPGADPVHKVTIIPRGDAGGFMMPLPEEKLVTTSREILAEIKVLFGGRAAEELVLEDISTGAYSDIKRATQLARTYVERVGMSKNLGPINFENSEEEFSFTTNKSDETVREIDLEIRKILTDEYLKTLNTLRENREKLENVAQLLLKKETITGEAVRKIIAGATFEDILAEEAQISEKKDEQQLQEKILETVEKVDEIVEEQDNTKETEELKTEIEENQQDIIKLEEDIVEDLKKEKENSEDSESSDEDNSDDLNDSDDFDNGDTPKQQEENVEKKEKKIDIPDFMK